MTGGMWKTLDAQLEFRRRIEVMTDTRICFAGGMDTAQRWDVIRRAIMHFKLDAALCGKSETFAQAFERCAGEPLVKAEAAA